MERVGTREIEGKVTRVGASNSGGERVSLKKSDVFTDPAFAYSYGESRSATGGGGRKKKSGK